MQSEKSSLTFNDHDYVFRTYSLERVLTRDREGSGVLFS